MISSEVPVYSRQPIEIVSGHGCTVTGSDGRTYTDFYGGHAVAALGYNHQALTAAIAAQAEAMLFQSNAVHIGIRQEAIDKLIQLAPEPLRQAFLVNSGAEAIENALRLAFLTTGRKRITALRGAFHGRTAGAAAITDHSSAWYGFPRSPFDVDWVTPESLADLELLIGEDTAAFIFEPVQGVAGAVDLSPHFVQRAAQICRDCGALLIADEIQTGIGRTGTMFAVEQLDVAPDIMTLAKGLGGGFPVSAVLCTEQVAACVSIGTLGTTFGGGPMACAAMNVVLEVVSEPTFLESVRSNSIVLNEECLSTGVRRVSGRGLLLGLHLETPAAPIRKALLERGFLTGDAKNPNVIRLLPPLIIGRAAIDAFSMALKEVLA